MNDVVAALSAAVDAAAFGFRQAGAGQQSSDDEDGELCLLAAIYNSHNCHNVEVPVDFLDKAQSECDHTRHAASNAAHSCDAQAVFEDQSVQDNRSAAEKADLAEASTCAGAAACRATSIKVAVERSRR